jgi:hypothetical protein
MCRQLTAFDRFPCSEFFVARGDQAFALRLLARELTRPADCFGLFFSDGFS